MTRKIYVTYCSRTKSEKKEGTPRELYTSQRIQSFFNRFPKPRAILSYKYGIVAEDAVIDNYEQDHFMDPEECAERIKAFVGSRTVIFYSPRKLVERPWINILNHPGIKYLVVRSYKDLGSE